MLYAGLKVLHVAAVLLWVGGMAFVHLFLRPSLATLAAPPDRLRLMQAVLARFLGAMTAVVAVVLVSGAWMVADVRQQVMATGGHLVLPLAWTLMTALGLVMALVFGVIRARLYPRFRDAVAAQQWPTAATALAAVRRWVLVNLVIGSVVVVVAVAAGA